MFLAALAASASPAHAAPRPSYVDARVTALSPGRLLSSAPAALVDPRRQRVALRLRRYIRPLFLTWALVQIGAFFYLWASGGAARLRETLRRRIRNPLALRFAFGAVLGAFAPLVAAPVSLVRYRIDVGFGLTRQTPASWLHDGLVSSAIEAVVVGSVVAYVFALVDRTRLWYLWATAGLVVLTLVMAFLEPVTVAPLYDRFTPLPATSPVRAPLTRLARRAGVGDAPIYVVDASRRAASSNADIAGFGPTKRIVLGDALLRDVTPGEVLFLSAREFGHYAHGDDFRLSLLWTLIFVMCTALAVVCADRVGFRRDDDPLARLALVFAFLGAFGLLATPLYNAYSRNSESRADAYALELTHDRVSAVRAYVRIADATLATLCPSRAVRLYFYNSPPLGTRIARAAGRPNPCP